MNKYKVKPCTLQYWLPKVGQHCLLVIKSPEHTDLFYSRKVKVVVCCFIEYIYILH